MAQFNPSPGIAQVPDEDRIAPIPGNQSMDTLFSGIGRAVGQVGDALTGLAKGADADIMNSIQKTADDILTVKNDQFGVGVAGAMNMTPGASQNQGQPLPPALQATQAQAQKAQAAYAQGAINSATYWATMNMAAKDIRAAYPGYNAEVDQIFNNITGTHTLAGHLREAVDEQMKNQQGGQQKVDNEINTKFMADLPYISMFDPTAATRFTTMTRDEKLGLVAKAAQFQGQEKMTTAQQGQLELQAKTGAATKTQAISLYGTQTNQIVNLALNAATASTGADAKSLTQQVNLFANPANKPTPDQVTAIDQGLNSLDARVTQQFMDLRNQYGGTQTGILPEDMEKAETAARAPFVAIRNMVHNGDYGAANYALQSQKMAVERDSQALYKSNEFFREAVLLGKMNLNSMLPYWGYANGSAVVGSLTPGFASKVLYDAQGGTIDAANAPVTSDPKLDPKDKTGAFTGGVNYTLDNIIQGRVQDQDVAGFANRNFTNHGAGFAASWSAMTDDGREKFFDRLASPGVQAAILKTGDPAAVNAYRSWMMDQMGSLKSVGGVAGDITKANTSGNTSGVTYSYNPSINQLQVNAPVADTPERRAQYGAAGDPTIAINVAKQNAAKFNVHLANIATFMKSEGVDPNGPDGIPHLFRNLQMQGNGIDLTGLQDVITTGTGKGGKAMTLQELQSGDDASLPSSVLPTAKDNRQGVRPGTGVSNYAPSATPGSTPALDAINSALADGSQRMQFSTGVQNFNPTNIGDGAWARSHGAVGGRGQDGDHQVAVFSSYQDGIDAAKRLALGKYNGGSTSADALIAGAQGWTPGNHVAAANVARTLGVSPTADLNLSDPTAMHQFIHALTVQEVGPQGAHYIYHGGVASTAGGTEDNQQAALPLMGVDHAMPTYAGPITGPDATTDASTILAQQKYWNDVASRLPGRESVNVEDQRLNPDKGDNLKPAYPGYPDHRPKGKGKPTS